MTVEPTAATQEDFEARPIEAQELRPISALSALENAERDLRICLKVGCKVGSTLSNAEHAYLQRASYTLTALLGAQRGPIPAKEEK
jgi:hypothetical protein